MKKLLKIIQVIFLSLGAIEVLGFGIFISFYITNFNDLKSNLGEEVVGYISIIIILLNILVMGILIFIVNAKKQKIDFTVTEALGKVSGTSYQFGKIGFIIYDENDNIIRNSDLFSRLNLNLIGNNIFSLFPKLSSINEDADSSSNDNEILNTIKINDNYYEVKALKSNRMFIFRDITEFENLRNLFNNNSLALGIIMIDNYSEIVQNNEDINDIIPQIRSVISSYAKQYRLVLRAYKSDSYLAIGKNEDVEAMKKDNFSVLTDVRMIGQKSDISTSLSMGFAYDYSSTSQINEMASNALSIAMSRGGDQAIVVQMNHDIFFAGGKTEAMENRNKVKVKSDANTLLNLIEENKHNKIFIMGHIQADMDAIGSCLGIMEICRYKNCDYAKIVYDPTVTERKARGALMSYFSKAEIEEMTISLRGALNECEQNSLLIVVDVNRPSIMMCPRLVEKTDKIIVIDHHRRSAEFVENLLFNIIDPSASSASELITEIIKYGSKFPVIPVDSKIATIMLSGIFMDTSFYKTKSVGVRTFEASMTLKEYGADNFKADDLLKDEYEEFSLISSIVDTMKTPYQGIVYCLAKEDVILEQATLAKAANQCIQLKGIKASFVVGRTDENSIRISARSDGTVNVQLICEKFGGGGHFAMAAALFKDTTIANVESLLLEALFNSLENEKILEKEKED